MDLPNLWGLWRHIHSLTHIVFVETYYVSGAVLDPKRYGSEPNEDA